ncbi:hypothetical protein CRE_06393 [Caenorhabditis remanei]|uniref:Uncharacterized protein n=1 Tax=Caenorhabditis remanei TaxID=31234 RepID=E3M1Y0_CAERE|nr:hypothetical protein CRE_06393 [Caenorhabditis remanei]
MAEIDFSIPYWLLNSYHIIGGSSLIFGIFSIYLIVFESSKIDDFRYFLLNLQVKSIVSIQHLILLTSRLFVAFSMQPVLLYPLVSGYIMGFSRYFGGTMYSCLLICIALIVYQVESIVFCFIRKHQTIANTLKKYKLPKWFVWSLFIFFVTALVLLIVFFSRTTVDQDKRFEYINEHFPQYLTSYQSLPNFSIYVADNYFITVVLTAVSAGIFSFSILCLIIVNIFRMLSILKTQISASNYQKHRVAVWSLLAQFATSSVCFVPPIFYVFIVLIGVNGAQCECSLLTLWSLNIMKFAVIVEYLLVIACLHSSLNVAVLVLTFPPYRKFVISLVRRKSEQGLSVKR